MLFKINIKFNNKKKKNNKYTLIFILILNQQNKIKINTELNESLYD